MLQDTEYHFGRYLAWLHRTRNFRKVIKRRQLVITAKVSLLLVALELLRLLIILTVAAVVYLAIITQNYWCLAAGLMLFTAMPFVLAYGLLVPLVAGWLLIQKPQEKIIVTRARKVLASYPAKRIGIAGSYGKTTTKEIIQTVLSEKFKVRATPGNMNTAIGISRFIQSLSGDEEILIFECGEEKPGDVRRLARLTKPDIGVITGVNEAHLTSFKTLEQTAETIFELADFVSPDKLYVNGESPLVLKYKPSAAKTYSRKEAANWQVKKASTAIDGTDFQIVNGKNIINVHTSLIGLHTVGVTAAAVAIADDFGLTNKQIEAGLYKIQAFEHRMEPKPLNGAWLIDDTYNGNSEGARAGLEFLKAIQAKRRIYVTPGLVEQGDQTEQVHIHIGEQAASSADIVVLMKNSVTEYITKGLHDKHFKGQLLEVDDPLDFYENLDQFVAAGDVVLMQNDWTDNYA
jgi:UDP-N-acetylmuramoyl-tripeptide--D-alanyl-D-alanine ligase